MTLPDFTSALHFGIWSPAAYDHAARFKGERLIPKQPTSDTGNGNHYLVADGDSYLTWGETGPDRTMHLIVGLERMVWSDEVPDIADAVFDFIASVFPGAYEYMRMVDYAVLTDSDRWGCLNGEEGETRLISTLRPVM